MSVNYATFTGTVTRNSIHQGVSSNGKAWARFGLAVGSSSYDKESDTYKKEPPFFCECVAFGKLATMIEPVLQEGVSLLVSGHFTTKGYKTNTGREGANHELTCDNIAVNCVPWQTINVTVNNANTTPTAGTSQTRQRTVPQADAWNNTPMSSQQYTGPQALGLSDNPAF